MEDFSNSYRNLIKIFGFSSVFNLRKKVSEYCLSLLEYVLEHELSRQRLKDIAIQEFADSLFNDVSLPDKYSD